MYVIAFTDVLASTAADNAAERKLKFGTLRFVKDPTNEADDDDECEDDSAPAKASLLCYLIPSGRAVGLPWCNSRPNTSDCD